MATSEGTISLTVRSMDNYVFSAGKTMLFSICGITRMQDNLNTSANAYNLSLPGTTQFVYVEGSTTSGQTASHKYTVDESTTTIQAMFTVQ